MLAIRFLRIGKKNSPSFRLVVTEKTAPPKGKFLEVVGFYNPGTKDWGLKSERAAYWIEHGAQPSDTAHNFLVKHGALKGPKIAVHAKWDVSAKSRGDRPPAGSRSENMELRDGRKKSPGDSHPDSFLIEPKARDTRDATEPSSPLEPSNSSETVKEVSEVQSTEAAQPVPSEEAKQEETRGKQEESVDIQE